MPRVARAVGVLVGTILSLIGGLASAAPPVNEASRTEDEESFEVWGPLRAIGASIASAIGGVAGAVIGWIVGEFLDVALGHPLGSSDGFLVIGSLTSMGLILGTLVGLWLGALGAHRLMGGRGDRWLGLVTTVLGVAAFVTVSYLNERHIYFPALVLPPIFAGVGLEFRIS